MLIPGINVSFFFLVKFAAFLSYLVVSATSTPAFAIKPLVRSANLISNDIFPNKYSF